MRSFILLLLLITSLGATASEKIISLSPSLTEIICFLEGEENLVARSSACDYPEMVKNLPEAGDFAIPSLEVIAKLKPDYVVADTLADPKVQKAIERLNIQFKLLPLNSFKEYKTAVSELGRLLNKTENAQNEVTRVEEFMAERAEIKSTPKRVLFVVWDSPIMSCGKQAFINEYLALAGGKNIFETQDIGYFTCSTESIIQANPEVIIYPIHDGRKMEFKTLKLLKDSKIYGTEDASLVCRLSPRWMEGVKLLEGFINEVD